MKILYKNVPIFIVLLLCLLSSCDLIEFKRDEDVQLEQEKALARVKDTYLYPHDAKGLVPAGSSKEDSTRIIERFVNNWIKKQLVIKEAQENLTYDEADLERKILEYRYALIIHKFEEYYVNSRLNTVVTEEEIKKYYDENIDNFLLKQPILRGRFVQVPKEAPNLSKLRKWMQSKSEKDEDDLRSYCLRYAKSSHLEDSVWVNFNDLIRYTPLNNLDNKLNFLGKAKFDEFSDENYLYLLKVNDYKIADDVSPLEFVQNDIEKIILNKRKVALANELEESIYEKAEKRDDFEIFSKK